MSDTRCYTESVFSGLKRIVLWDYPRAGWQYDIMVGVITGFVFLTPRSWFQDQPRIPAVSRIMAAPGHGLSAYLLEPEVVNSIPESRRPSELARIISARTGRKESVSRVEPIFDSEGAIHLYVVYTRP